MKVSKTICAALVAVLLVFQNFVPMVPVIAETVETNEPKTVVETEAPKETKKSSEDTKPKETKKPAETKATAETTKAKETEAPKETAAQVETTKKAAETKVVEAKTTTETTKETVKETITESSFTPSETKAKETIPSETKATEETVKPSETVKPEETTIVSEPEETETKETETSPSTETAAPTEPSETTATTEETKPSETEPSETETTESSESSETSESSEPSESSTEAEESKIVTAKSADEYIKFVAQLPDGDKLVVTTKDDLAVLKPGAGVYYDGSYTLWFETDAAYDAAVKYASAHNYEYLKDGAVSLCGTADFSKYAESTIDRASSASKTRVVIIDTGVNGADEAYSVVGTDVKDHNGHGTLMGKLIKKHSDNKAYIISVKAIADNGKGTVSDVYAALQFASEQKADIILMAISIRNKADYSSLGTFIEEIASKTILVASAGNNNDDAGKFLPAGLNNVLTVGAVTSDYHKESASNYGSLVNYYAVAESTSEAAAVFTGKLIVKDVSNVVVSYIGEIEGEPLFLTDDDLYFSINASGRKLLLSSKDLKKTSTAAFKSLVISEAKKIADGSDWTYGSCDENNKKLDCVGYVNRVYYLALRSIYDNDHDAIGGTFVSSWKDRNWSGPGYKVAYRPSSQKYASYIARCGAKSVGAWLNECNIALYPHNSSSTHEITGSNDDKKFANMLSYLKSQDADIRGNKGTAGNGLKGCIIAYGRATKTSKKGTVTESSWYHTAIFDSFTYNDNGTITGWKEYGAVGTGIAAADQIRLVTRNISTTIKHKANYILVLNPRGTTTGSSVKFVKKSIDNPEVLGNCYSLEGTTYGLYTDAACTTPYAAMPTITFDADGETDDGLSWTNPTFPIQFYMTELKAGKGYQVDDSVYFVDIRSTTSGTVKTVSGDGTATGSWSGNQMTVTLTDTPVSDPFTIQLRKAGVNHSAATMDKATFRVRYYDGKYAADPADFPASGFDTFTYDDEGSPTSGVTPTDDFTVTITNPETAHTLTLKELAGYGSGVSVSGDNDMLKAIYDADAFINQDEYPLGTYRICEVTAPTGYMVNDTVFRITIYQDANGDGAGVTYNEKTGSKFEPTTIDNNPGVAIRLSEINGPAKFSADKTVSDNSSKAGFDFELDQGSTLFATGKSETDGRVKWTYKITNYYKTNEDPEHGALTDTLLTGTSAYVIDIPANAEFEIREVFDSATEKAIWKLPDGWTDGNLYFSKKFTSGEMLKATVESVTNKPTYKPYSLTKELQTSDSTKKPSGFKFTIVDENEKVYANGVSLESGKVQWTYTKDGVIPGRTTAGSKTESLLLLPNRADGTEIKYQVREIISDKVEERGIPEGWNDGNGYFYKDIDLGSADVISDTVKNYDVDLKTKATAAAGNTVEYSETATITDTVSYKNLIPGKEYTITGKLVLKSSGKYVKGDDGKVIESSKTFTAPSSEGTVDIPFTFNAKLYQGETIVVFEDLKYNGVVYAVHADINDEEQTVFVPGIKTSATDANKNKVFKVTDKAVVVDEVTYTNLTPGKKYRVEGILIDKTTKAPLQLNGKTVVASAEFTPTKRNGTVKVTFKFDATAIDLGKGGKNGRKSKEIVVYEKLFDISEETTTDANGNPTTVTNNTLVSAHEDINDKNQTVTLKDSPQTGDHTGFTDYTAGLIKSVILATVAGIVWFIIEKKKRRDNEI